MKLAVLVAAFLLTAGTAGAQQVDMSKLKCRDFIELPKEVIAGLTVWLDGYFTDEEEAAVVDFEKLKTKGEKLSTYCAQNPRMRVMSAAEDVIHK